MFGAQLADAREIGDLGARVGDGFDEYQARIGPDGTGHVLHVRSAWRAHWSGGDSPV